MKPKCGLLGKTLKHSYSPRIHNSFGDYEYLLYEKTESEIEDFLKNGDFVGLNVTIPYKKTVMPFMDELSDAAKNIGSINTIVKKDGKLFGDNTDMYGFCYLVESSGYDIKGKKGLVLGSGGASLAVKAALSAMGAEYVVISRSGENNYGNLYLHADADFIVNTTPVGMYPNVGESPLDLKLFPKCEIVFDIIYNPAHTALMLQAEELGIKTAGGLKMLVAQAKRSSEQFTGTALKDGDTERVIAELSADMQNIILIGMPGSGKTTLGKAIASNTSRKFVDADDAVYEKTGKKPSAIIKESGEAAFREIESEILRDLGMQSGLVIATGGGAVTREENYSSLHRNGVIIWLKREINNLDVSDRPLSQGVSFNEMYLKREPLYKRFCDISLDIGEGIAENAKIIANAYKNFVNGGNK